MIRNKKALGTHTVGANNIETSVEEKATEVEFGVVDEVVEPIILDIEEEAIREEEDFQEILKFQGGPPPEHTDLKISGDQADEPKKELSKAERFSKLLSEAKPVDALAATRFHVVNGVVTIVSSKGNGKRIALPQSVLARLGNPKTIGIGYNSTGIFIGEKHSRIQGDFTLKTQGSKGIVYSASLVNEITVRFDLNFSDKVSMTFYDIEYSEEEGHLIAYIQLREEVSA